MIVNTIHHTLAPQTADTENSQRCIVSLIYGAHSSKYAVLKSCHLKEVSTLLQNNY
jgi:hypothetical protein